MTFSTYTRYDIPEAIVPITLKEGLTIIIDETHFQSAQKALLDKILAAVNMSMDQAQILSWSEERYGRLKLKEVVYPHTLLLFGISPSSISIQAEQHFYHPYRLGLITYIYAHHLDHIADDQDLKKLLWSALKSHFLPS